MGSRLPVPLAPPITCNATTSLDNLTHAERTVSVRQPRLRRTWQPRPASLVVAIRALTAAFARCSRFRLQTSLFMNDCVHKNGSDLRSELNFPPRPLTVFCQPRPLIPLSVVGREG